MNLHKKPREVQRFYTVGQQQEHYILRWLKAKQYKVTHATREEDLTLDVDLWIGQGNKRLGISIKTNEPKYFKHPFVFELTFTNSDGKKYDSWYQQSKADYFLVWKRWNDTAGKLFLIDIKQLREYVDENGFDTECQTTYAVAKRELAAGKIHTWLGLIEQQTLLDRKIALHIGNLDIADLPPEQLTTRKIK